MTIATFAARRLPELLALWNRSLPHDALETHGFAKRVLYDINFDPELFLLAEEGGALIGFCYLTLRRVPDECAGLEAGKAYLVALGVHPEHRRHGAGRALLAHGHALLRARGVTQVVACCYADNYFCPGVDREAYPEGVPFLRSMGYTVTGECVSMARSLQGFVYPEKYRARKAALEAQGYRFAPFTPGDAPALFAFLRAELPHMLPLVRQALVAGRGEETLLLAHAPDGEIAGFVLRAMDGCPERFGPFGTRAALQGGGLGGVLFHEMMQSMAERHIYYTHFLWTDGRNPDIYATWGMHVYRRCALLSVTL